MKQNSAKEVSVWKAALPGADAIKLVSLSLCYHCHDEFLNVCNENSLQFQFK